MNRSLYNSFKKTALRKYARKLVKNCFYNPTETQN